MSKFSVGDRVRFRSVTRMRPSDIGADEIGTVKSILSVVGPKPQVSVVFAERGDRKEVTLAHIWEFEFDLVSQAE
ncbi:MAG: hypothetical protein WDN69_26435 [Aliidongia sp.]